MPNFLNIKPKYCVIILALFNICCKSNKTSEVKKVNDTNIIFETKEIEEKILNDNKTLVLVLNYNQTKNLPIKFDYSVIELSSNKVLKKGAFTGLKMEWYDLYKIKGYLYEGIIKKEDDIIDENTINNINDNIIIINLDPKQ
jgi:hypothetical protein